MNLRFAIRQKAYQIGFDLCGFTSDFVPKHKDYFLQWLHEERFADMQWLGQNAGKRLDPKTILAETKSVIVLACSYAHEPEKKDYALARYAHGEDYHQWMKKKVTSLAVWLESQTTQALRWRGFVDTGPVLERDLAAKTGLGWVGKNTNLIHKDLGSYLFLSVLFCDLELAADFPSVDLCGACTLCLQACPTQALTAYQLDPGKCLAYHNIEKRGVRDAKFWTKLGENLVGCDICQEVCPHNHLAPHTRQKEWLQSFAAFDFGDLRHILQMSEMDYKIKSKTSAVSRIKYADFMRNVFLVIGNTKRFDLLSLVLAWQKQNPQLMLEELSWCLKKIAAEQH